MVQTALKMLFMAVTAIQVQKGKYISSFQTVSNREMLGQLVYML